MVSNMEPSTVYGGGGGEAVSNMEPSTVYGGGGDGQQHGAVCCLWGGGGNGGSVSDMGPSAPGASAVYGGGRKEGAVIRNCLPSGGGQKMETCLGIF